jgi:deoxyguanosine kinase
MSKRRRQAMHSSAFLIDGDKRRRFRSAFPEAAAQGEKPVRLAAIICKQDKSAKSALLEHESLFVAQAFALATDHEHLTDLLPQAFHALIITQTGQAFGQRVNSHGRMARAKYIVVEGPIGVGKSSLAKILANEFHARTVFERVEDNPFLPKFYKSRETYAFQNQTFFLLNRYQQQMELAQQDLFNQGTVADYLFAKDQIFATLTLSSEELNLYQQIYALLNARIPKPDLVVYLQARPEVLYKRVKKRDKKYERSVTFEYLTEVAQAYNQYFFHYDETPLLVVNTSEIDFVSSSKHLADLIKEINSMGSGTQHYIPLGSR